MPIFGTIGGLFKEPWSFCDNINKKSYFKIRNCLFNAMDNKKYPEQFLRSIKACNDTTSFLASFDISKTNINIAYYQEYIEKLINDSNDLLSKDKKYDNYKIDIAGSFTTGKFIILEKK